MNLKPKITEKAMMLIESQNILVFEVDQRQKKQDIKKEIEELFSVKIDKIRTLIRNNRKQVYAKLNKDFLAIDVATKLGLI